MDQHGSCKEVTDSEDEDEDKDKMDDENKVMMDNKGQGKDNEDGGQWQRQQQ